MGSSGLWRRVRLLDDADTVNWHNVKKISNKKEAVDFLLSLQKLMDEGTVKLSHVSRDTRLTCDNSTVE